MTPNCYVYFLTSLVFTNNVLNVNAEKVLGEEFNEEFDFDGLPGAQHEFKVEVRAGTEECFYQHAKVGAKFHVSFEVLRGGDRKVDFIVKDPNHKTIALEPWKSDGALEKDIEVEGDYQLCIDNIRARFGSKLVLLELVIFTDNDWEMLMRDISEYEDIKTELSESLEDVEQSITQMRRFQSHTRMNIARDWYLIQGNSRYISYYSLVQCCVIVLSSLSQVYVLRRLFRTVSVTPTAKPRIYQVCLSNTKGQFSSKLIFLYIVVFKMAEWAQYAKDLAEIHDMAANLSIKLADVQLAVTEMFKFQTLSKMHDVKDWYTISSNNKYVSYWSLFQCSVIVTASGLQVYFLKRLFGTTNVTPISQKA